MVANNGCHPLRACNALYVLYDGSIRRGVLNLFYMKSYTVQLTAYHKAYVSVSGGIATILIGDHPSHVPVRELVQKLLSRKQYYLETIGSRMTSRKINMIYQS